MWEKGGKEADPGMDGVSVGVDPGRGTTRNMSREGSDKEDNRKGRRSMWEEIKERVGWRREGFNTWKGRAGQENGVWEEGRVAPRRDSAYRRERVKKRGWRRVGLGGGGGPGVGVGVGGEERQGHGRSDSQEEVRPRLEKAQGPRE